MITQHKEYEKKTLRPYGTPELRRYGRIEHITLQSCYTSGTVDKTFAEPDFLTHGITVNGSTVGDHN